MRLSLRSELGRALLATLFFGGAGGIAMAILNNYLADVHALDAAARGWLELPREAPGFAIIFVSAAMLLVLRETQMAALAMFFTALGGVGLPPPPRSSDVDAGRGDRDPDDTSLPGIPNWVPVPRPLPPMSDATWLDLLGQPRTFGAQPDRGAYELQISCPGITFPHTAAPGVSAAQLRLAVDCANALPDPNVIDLGGQTVTFTDSAGDFAGATALPSIVSPLTLADGVLERDGGAAELRLLHIDDGGDLTVDAMTFVHDQLTKTMSNTEFLDSMSQ